MVYIDLYIEELRQGYNVYGIKRGGEKELIGRHAPWFALYVPRGKVKESVEIANNMPRVVKAEPIDIAKIVPIIPADEYGYRHVPNPDYTMIRVFVEKKEYVPHIANSLKRSLQGAYIGVSNIVYPVRVSFDLDIKYFHPKCPILFHPNKELEELVTQIIEKNNDLKIMSFDIEVATEPGRFPRPGDPIISIQYGVMRLNDPEFMDQEWPEEHVEVLMAESLTESRYLVNEFLEVLRKERPDILVGYNSVAFDVKYIKPFLDYPVLTFPDPHHVYLGDYVFPHIDLMEARDRMGSSLGLRSQRARALEDVVRELVKGTDLEWVLTSKYMLAEERLDHSKIVNEWKNKTQLFYDYVTADAYFTLIIARFWMLTFALLSALVQIPPTVLTKLNTGQTAEYSIIHWLEKLGFEPVIIERNKEFRKVKDLGFAAKYVPEKYAELFKKGKVYVKEYGVFENIVEGDFAQLYPTLMSNEALDPLAFRAWKIMSHKNPFGIIKFSDPLFEGLDAGKPRYKVVNKLFMVLLGTNPGKKAADYMLPTNVYYVLSLYGPISFILYKQFIMRKITKGLKKLADKLKKPELKAPDKAVKITNNSLYGGMSKRRGFINQVMAGYIFWKTLKILYDVIEYAESLGLNVLYGDTDSIFLQCRVDEAKQLYPDKPTKEACKKWFVEHILPRLNKYVREKYGKEFEIEFEASFDICIYPKLKKGAGASKKSYICGNFDETGRLRVEVFKGDFYKALAPEAIREKLAQFYEEIIMRKPNTSVGVEKIMAEFLRNVPPHKYFVKKIIDSFKSKNSDEKDSAKYTVRLKNLNKNFHYAALHVAYAWGFPGITVEYRNEKRKNEYEVRYHVDPDKVLSTGDIVVYFLPGTDPKQFTVYIDYDSKTDRVKVHKVTVRKVEKTREKEGKDVYRETGYLVEATYIEQWISRKELLAITIGAMRRYIIDDISKKLLPALNTTYGGVIDKYFDKEEDKG